MNNEVRTQSGETIRLTPTSQTSISSAIKSLQSSVKTKANKADVYTQSETEDLLNSELELIKSTIKEEIGSISTSLQSKVDTVDGKQLSSNDFTNEHKAKLESLKQGLDGKDGQDGKQGEKGEDGLSAYDLAKQQGYNGSLTDWLKSLKGDKGQSGANGRDGSSGKDGKDGLSAYEIAVKRGFKGTETQWLKSLKGKDGRDGKSIQGPSGASGLSAYQIAVRNGFVGSEKDWLKSLKGSGAGGSNDYNDLINTPNLDIYALKDETFDKEEIHEMFRTQSKYDDTEVRELITGLQAHIAEVEAKEDKDTIYNDSELRGKIQSLESQIGGLTSGADSNYIHNQSQSSEVWTINHNLNKYPSVTVVDTAGSVVEGEVTFISLNEIRVAFSSPFSGKAILN